MSTANRTNDYIKPAPGQVRRRGGGRRRLRGERGYVVAMTGLLIIPLLAFTAFAVDVGAWYAQASQMQRAADAAALAGVVWVSDPIDPVKYDTVARDTATRNGFTNGVNGVTVTTNKLSGNQLKVTISAAGDQFFSELFMPNGQRLTRSATAEYVEPVPLGSPRNYLGTGGLGTSTDSTSAYFPERLWGAVSGQCTDKIQGDRVASRYFNGSDNNNCTGTLNTDYNTMNYQYYIELPATRTYATDVVIYHGNFVQNSSCNSGALATPQPNEFCPGGLDSQPLEPTTFTLYQVDGTPLDDTDNPTMASVNGCASSTAGVNGTKTFDAKDPTFVSGNQTVFADDNYDFSMANFTNAPGMWRICQIPAAAPGGKYILRVRNQNSTSGAATSNNGSNAFSIIATPNSPQRLCDARSDTTCPKVFARDYLSIYALANGAANFWLSEIGPQHAGKTVRIQLWDSAEGATELRIKRPTGTNTWVDQSFNWSSTCSGCSGTNVTSIPVSSYNFNGRLVNIEFTLPSSYSPPTDNKWWRIYYVYSSSATDRTTWSVEILGDPVHLVE